MMHAARQLDLALDEYQSAARRSNHPSYRDDGRGDGLRILRQYGPHWLRRQIDWLDMGCVGRQPISTISGFQHWIEGGDLAPPSF